MMFKMIRKLLQLNVKENSLHGNVIEDYDNKIAMKVEPFNICSCQRIPQAYLVPCVIYGIAMQYFEI